MTWQQSAACARIGGGLWDPLHHGEKENSPRVLEALAVCATCPVAEPCARLAEQTGSLGIYGGHVYRSATGSEYCAVEGCEKRRTRDALCSMHRWRMAKHGSYEEPPKRPEAKCGTPAGRKRHERLKEAPCADCRRAGSDYARARRAKRAAA